MDFFSKLAAEAPQTAIILWALYYGLRQLKEDVSSIKSRMDCFEKSQHACQLENAKEFATKVDLDSVETRVNELDTRVSRIEGAK